MARKIIGCGCVAMEFYPTGDPRVALSGARLLAGILEHGISQSHPVKRETCAALTTFVNDETGLLLSL